MALFNATQFFNELAEIKSLITISNAEFIGVDEASKHLGLSRTYLYSLVHKGKLPFYKPNGKKIYFNKLELNGWIAKSKIRTADEIENEINSVPLDNYTNK